MKLRREVDGLPPREWHLIDVSADGTEIAHQSADEDDTPTIGCCTWHGDLKGRMRDHPYMSRAEIDGINVGHPPIVVAVPFGGSCHQTRSAGCPVVFVNVRVGRRDQPQCTACARNDREALFVNGGP